jgi:hypothetical protein
MRFELELQYADFHPDQVDKVGLVDLDQALNIIHSYPWDREFEKMKERDRDNLTSTIPAISLKNNDKEIVIISARDRDSFIIEFKNATHSGELIIPHNSFENQQGFSTEELIARFYDNTLKATLTLKPLTRAEKDETKIFELREYPLFISGLTVAILTLILIFDLASNGLTAQALPAVYFVGIIMMSMGFSALLTVQYLLTDWGKQISFEQDGVLTIKQKGKEVKLKRSEIDHVAVVENNNNHRTLRYYKYARIKTKDGKALIVTSFIMEPLDLVNKLKMNHKEESVFLPTINYDLLSEKQKEKIKRDKEKKKNEFLEKFKNFEDSKLRQLIADKKSYTDDAIEAATVVLERRKKVTAANIN